MGERMDKRMQLENKKKAATESPKSLEEKAALSTLISLNNTLTTLSTTLTLKLNSLVFTTTAATVTQLPNATQQSQQSLSPATVTPEASSLPSLSAQLEEVLRK